MMMEPQVVQEEEGRGGSSGSFTTFLKLNYVLRLNYVQIVQTSLKDIRGALPYI